MIAIGSDHAGYGLKCEIIALLEEKGIAYNDVGCYGHGEKADYPCIAEAACTEVVQGRAESAILICGTGIGISMAANKIPGIRAAVCHDYYTAKYTRLHNDANVLCMGGRVVGAGVAVQLAEVFLETAFDGGRHKARVDMIMSLENKKFKGEEND